MDFNSLWFNTAILYAKKSKDPRTKVGAVIVDMERKQAVSGGYNGPPRGWDDAEEGWQMDKAFKALVCEHAERNAIYNAARLGVKTEGCDIFVTLAPCNECARALWQAGIKNIWVPAQFSDPNSDMGVILYECSQNYKRVYEIDWKVDEILVDGVERKLYCNPTEVAKAIFGENITAQGQVSREDL